MTIRHTDEGAEFTLIERESNKVLVVDLKDGDTYELDFGVIRATAMSRKDMISGDHRLIPQRVLQSYIGEYLRQHMIWKLQEKPAHDIWYDKEYRPYLESR